MFDCSGAFANAFNRSENINSVAPDDFTFHFCPAYNANGLDRWVNVNVVNCFQESFFETLVLALLFVICGRYKIWLVSFDWPDRIMAIRGNMWSTISFERKGQRNCQYIKRCKYV